MNQAQSESRQGTAPGALCLWNGLTVSSLVKLLALRPAIDWKHSGRLASIAGMSVSNSASAALERLIYNRRIRETQLVAPPVFVLGHWRSGTTMLHNLLTLDPQTTYCNLYHILFPDSFLLTEKVVTRLTTRLIPATRPMDRMPLSWDHPQEDETALMLKTLLSPYLMVAFQNDPEVYERFFSLQDASGKEREQWKQALLHFFKKLTLRDPRRLVLKSPAHTFRIPLLLELFPDAKFAFIARNPYKVFSSTMHLRRTMFTDNALATPDLSGIEDQTLSVYRGLFDTYEQDRHLIPEGNLHELRFEELEADPLGQVARLYDALTLPDFERLEPRIRTSLFEHRAHRKNAYSLEASLKERIDKQWEPAFERFNYAQTLPDPGVQTA